MSQFRQPPGSFKVVLGIMLSIQKNNDKLDSDMDNDMLRLWVYTLMGMGYIRKEARDYVLM